MHRETFLREVIAPRNLSLRGHRTEKPFTRVHCTEKISSRGHRPGKPFFKRSLHRETCLQEVIAKPFFKRSLHRETFLQTVIGPRGLSSRGHCTEKPSSGGNRTERPSCYRYHVSSYGIPRPTIAAIIVSIHGCCTFHGARLHEFQAYRPHKSHKAERVPSPR